MDNKVCLSVLKGYDKEKIYTELKSHFDSLGLNREFLENKKVCIKPNLVADKHPDKCATTHPHILYALIRILNEYNIKPVIAESPGGVYSAARMKNTYKVCMLNELLDETDCILNEDVSYERIPFDTGETVKSFEIIKPIVDCDIIFDVSKLKTHALTTMTGTIKNLFGTVPGVKKFEMHSAYPGYENFGKMIIDLCYGLCTQKQVIAITDAIVCMEGDGPTSGSPRYIGGLITSKNPFANDLLSEYILGMKDEVYIINESINRGYIPKDILGLDILGNPDEIKVDNFVRATDNNSASIKLLNTLSKGKIGRLFMPKPFVTDKCVGCSNCVRNCPVQTIKLVTKKENGKIVKKAKIITSNCIRCYCCQELCPFSAVIIKSNPVLKILSGIKK